MPQRSLVVTVSAVATVGALVIDLGSYRDFLYLLGSFFVPLFGVLLADWLRRAATIGARHLRRAGLPAGTIGAWIAGFALYQWLQPVGPSWWTDVVVKTHPHALPWGGASLPSFAAAFALTVAATFTSRRLAAARAVTG